LLTGGREEVAGLRRHASTSAHTSTLPITHLDCGTDITLPLIHLMKISGKSSNHRLQLDVAVCESREGVYRNMMNKKLHNCFTRVSTT
jgi:hypothetical protein